MMRQFYSRRVTAMALAPSSCAVVAAHRVCSSSWFDQYKADTLAAMQNPAADRSLAGRVDPQIQQMVQTICSQPNFVTLSSCSGRIALFHRGHHNLPHDNKIAAAPAAASPSSAPMSEEERVGVEAGSNNSTKVSSSSGAPVSSAWSKRGAFGRGTLFQSHDPLSNVPASTEALLTALQSFARWRVEVASSPLSVPPPSDVLQLKFEPMILHIACRHLTDASAVLVAANDAGQRRSGILSMSHSAVAAPVPVAVDAEGSSSSSAAAVAAGPRKITVCVTSALTYDVPMLINGKWALGASPLEAANSWRSLCATWIEHANELFVENEARKERFLEAFLKRCSS